MLPGFPSPFVCKVTNDDSAQLVYAFDPKQYKQLFFHLDKDMVNVPLDPYSSHICSQICSREITQLTSVYLYFVIVLLPYRRETST